ARAGVLDATEAHADPTPLGALGTAQADFGATTRRLAETRIPLAALARIAGFAVQMLAAVALAVTLWAGLLALEADAMSGAVLAGLVLAVLGSFEATGAIVRSIGKLTTAMAAAERLMAIAQLPPTALDPPQPRPWPETTEIVFSDVGF